MPKVLWAMASTMGLLVSGIWTLALPAPPASAGPPVPVITKSSTPALGPLDAPDPDMVRDGSTLYAFTTGTTWGNQIGIAQTTSSNPEKGWSIVGGAFPQLNFTVPPAPWEIPETTTSPGVFHFGGQWVMYYDANVKGSGRTCLSVATSASVTGPYVDSSGGPIVCQLNLGGSLDPQPFVDPATGRPYLLWKSNDGSSQSPSQVWSQPLDSTGTHLTGSPTSIFTIVSGTYGWETATDDPSMVFDGGNYYLFFSAGNFQTGFYVIGYTLCAGPNGGCDENPQPDSNFLLSGPGGTGGGMVFPTGGQWWVSYQSWSPPSCTNYSCGSVREMFVAPISLPPPPSPSITTGALSPAGTGTPYTQSLSAVSGLSPYVWTITSGQLPNGLTLNSATGVVSGTPTQQGTSSVTFEVTDGNGSTATKNLSLLVRPGSTTTAKVDPTSTLFGSPVTYSATVAAFSPGGTPTGTVTFSVGSTALCTTPTLMSGAGSCNAANAPAGADTVTATYSGDTTFAPSSGNASLVVASGAYSPLTPVRVCDTRAGNPSVLSGPAAQCDGPGGTGTSGTTIPAGGTRTFNVAGNFGVPSTADAVVLNVAVVNPAARGYLTAFPTGAAQPLASNLNYAAGQAVPNLVEVGIGSSGNVSIYSLAQADIVVDLEGYVAPTAAGGSGAGLYTPLSSPARLCDTRAGDPSHLSGDQAQCNGMGNAGETLAAGGTLPVKVAGVQLAAGEKGIPGGATAAVLNVSVVNPAASGFLTIFPQDAAQPTTANVNYTAGQTTGNRVIVPLSSNGTPPGQISIYSKAAADVVVDVSGYYSAPGGSGAQFTAEPTPVRICDTRAGNPSGLTGTADQCDNRTIGQAGSDTIQVSGLSGLAGVPNNATAVVVNLTAVSPTTGTFLTVFPNLPRPLVSDLNPAAGDVKGNLTVATLSSSGKISIYNNTGNVNVVVDVLGWYA